MPIDKTMLAALAPSKPMETKEGFDSILYGDPKSGKTTTLDDPNMKVLLLDLEGGSSVLAGSPNVDIVKIDSLEQLNAYADLISDLKWINHEGKLAPLEHGLIAIDSITRLQDLVKSYVVRVVAPNRQREIKDSNLAPEQRFGAQSDWGNFGIIISDLIKYFHTLTKRGDKSVNVMWLAHKDNKYENPAAENMVTGTQIKMQGGSVPIVMSVVDAIFYMNKGEIKNPKTSETNMYYWIQTDRVGVTEAGVRQSRREEKLPVKIFNPVWSDIFTTLGYKTEAPTVKLKGVK
jgi:hypothetical protein